VRRLITGVTTIQSIDEPLRSRKVSWPSVSLWRARRGSA
jgi:hypothetical protein